jgi:hypothetical protein
VLTYLYHHVTDNVDNVWKSLITPDQIATLQSYLVKYNVKLVRINDSPDASTGVSPVGNGWGTGVDQQIFFDSTPIATTLATNVNLSPLSTFSSAWLYHYPGDLTNPAIATPILKFKPSLPDFVNDTIAAAVLNISTSTSGSFLQFSFYLPFNAENPTSVQLSKVWLNWVSNGEFPPSASAPTSKFSVLQRVLVVSSSDSEDVKAATNILDAYSMPFDAFVVGSGVAVPMLEKVVGSLGAYSLVVLTCRLGGELIIIS